MTPPAVHTAQATLRPPFGQVVILPEKSGNYHFSVPQPSARSVRWYPHTGTGTGAGTGTGTGAGTTGNR